MQRCQLRSFAHEKTEISFSLIQRSPRRVLRTNSSEFICLISWHDENYDLKDGLEWNISSNCQKVQACDDNLAFTAFLLVFGVRLAREGFHWVIEKPSGNDFKIGRRVGLANFGFKEFHNLWIKANPTRICMQTDARFIIHSVALTRGFLPCFQCNDFELNG